MRKLISMLKYNTRLLFRDMSSVLFAFLMPIGFYILFANMLGGIEVDGGTMGELMIPLYTIIIIGNAVICVYGGFYAQARESGNLTKYKFLGVNELVFSVSLYGATVIFQVIVIVSFLIFTRIYAGISFPLSRMLPVMVVLIVINLYQYAVSYFLNAVIRKASLYNSISLTVYMFQMFLGGLTFPIEMFPAFLRKAVFVINPIIYGRNALIDVWSKQTGLLETMPNILILLAVSAGLIVLGGIINQAFQQGRTSAVIR